jgi:uncharacterized membrane protein YtjA (UPF0391 family)
MRVKEKGGNKMLSWALTFFVIALVAAVLGFRGIAGMSAEIGYLLAVLALIFVVIALFVGHSTVPS